MGYWKNGNQRSMGKYTKCVRHGKNHMRYCQKSKKDRAAGLPSGYKKLFPKER